MDLERTAEIIRGATVEVFQMMLGSEPSPQAAFADEDPFFKSEVTGLIGFGGAAQGYVTVHCSFDQGKAFTARLLDMEPEQIDDQDEIRDAMGEVVNMIAGSVKTALAEDGVVEISLPSVIFSEKPDASVKGCVGSVVPFDDPSGTFHVELVMAKS